GRENSKCDNRVFAPTVRAIELTWPSKRGCWSPGGRQAYYEVCTPHFRVGKCRIVEFRLYLALSTAWNDLTSGRGRLGRRTVYLPQPVIFTSRAFPIRRRRAGAARGVY